MRSVKKGYRHLWKYKGVWDEKKIAPGKWKVTFKATKRKRAKGYGGFNKGFRINWRFSNVRQRAVKTAKGRYQTILTATKHVDRRRKRRKY